MYSSKARVKYFLLVHLIFVVKYRKPLLAVIGQEVKDRVIEIAKTSRFEIETMEVDQDHIHLLVKYEPNISISHMVNLLKQGTTYHLWQKHPNRLKLSFWKERIFWSPSYFACSVGQITQEAIRKYIEEQG
ncbi:MAG: IS200/IS605 family transposase [Richelia sp. RM2_1_2]|nr:IS200/IS605 family transposase [Richelia sp. RM2_1_2]